MDKAETEKESARRLANTVLERPYVDPDDDLATLSRQLLRADEEIARLKAELAACETEVRVLRKSQDEARDEIVRLDGMAGKWERFGGCSECQAKTDQARAERDTALEALRGVVSVADRKTKEFDAARACLARLPHAAERAQAVRDVVAAARAWAHADPTDGQQVLELDAAVARLDALESGGGE